MFYRRTIFTVSIILLLSTAAAAGARWGVAGKPVTSSTPDDQLTTFFQKDTVTIVITDSGLGGVSVAAAIERMLQQYRVFGAVRLIFANALPDREHLYNQMASLEEKAEVFDSALSGMSRTLRPDVILIACNTLSVVFPYTDFARSSDVPVVGIVEFGVDGIARALQNDSTASAIVLGTPTTIGQNTHAAALAEIGFDSTRVDVQACEMLESEIQADPNSDVVRTMIEMYAGEALDKQDDGLKGDLVVALCCSHYGFARQVFQEVFQSLSGRRVAIIDPNIGMGEYLFPQDVRERRETTHVTVTVVSKAEILPDEAASIAGAVRPVSAAVADAVTAYVRDTTLFSF